MNIDVPEFQDSISTAQSKSPEIDSGLAVMLDDARHFNAICPDKHVKKDLQIRVTSEGEGIEP
jgi:hypothetical protein